VDAGERLTGEFPIEDGMLERIGAEEPDRQGGDRCKRGNPKPCFLCFLPVLA